MKAIYIMAAMLVLCSVASARAADRLTDRDVKELVARIEQGRDTFDNALEDKFKKSIARGDTGEVNVKEYMNDFQEAIDRLEKRLKPGYAASAEVAAVLRQASAMSRFFGQQPPGMRGVSEWNRLEADLRTLARAYAADFPLAEGASVRRIGDREVAGAAEAVDKAGRSLKKSLDADAKTDPRLDKTTRQNIAGQADDLSKAARVLSSRLKEGKPSSAEADAVLAQASRIDGLLEPRNATATKAAWAAASAPLKTLSTAYAVAQPQDER
jgi:hypothetical protein